MLFVQDGKIIPKVLKSIRRHWVRVAGRYYPKDSEHAEKFLRNFRKSIYDDLNTMLDNLTLDRPAAI